MAAERRPARLLSTPMIKGELRSLLDQLAPEKGWPKNTRLKDLIEFTLRRFAADTPDTDERRALELAHVLQDHERR